MSWGKGRRTALYHTLFLINAVNMLNLHRIIKMFTQYQLYGTQKELTFNQHIVHVLYKLQVYIVTLMQRTHFQFL